MKKGFTLIELLAVIVILAVIALIATPIILGIIIDAKKSAFKDTAYGIVEAAKNEYIKEMYKTQNPSNITFTYTNGAESSSVVGKSLNYNGLKPSNGTVALTKNGDVAIAIHDGTNCVYKSYSDSEVTLEIKNLSECTTDYSINKGVNAPKLTEGMTPVKWDGATWIDTTVSDKDWYSYDTANKKWANAKTADGSMWVWIPRYIYKITSGWHSNTTGTMEIQFSKGTNDNWNNASIGNINTNTTANASNNTWTNHPGFTFGTTELTGIWVAKFEATAVEGVANGYTADGSCPIVGDNVTTKTIKSTPNVQSWRCITIGNAFTVIRNMETNSLYGWTMASGLQVNGNFTTDTNGVNTHLMKNIEWGIAAYLSKSQYGKNFEEIYINNSQTYTTGCAGNTATADEYNGCQNTYETGGGIKASTTGTIYGIYDLSGSSWEFTSSYINNGNTNLAGQGLSIVNANAKYKDVYNAGSTDDEVNNYSLVANYKGDAIWETSNNISSYNSWFNDYSYMPNTSNPWFRRSGNWNTDSSAGAFNFHYTSGGTRGYDGFRPVLVVGNGL